MFICSRLHSFSLIFPIFPLIQIWVFNALKLEEKRHFVSSFCRTLATLLPHVIKDIELVNFPQDINISPLSQHETLDALLSKQNELTFMIFFR